MPIKGLSANTSKVSPALAPTKEDPMPDDRSGTFVMNPNAPVFVPQQEDPPSMLLAPLHR